jgi:hypothetical protein
MDGGMAQAVEYLPSKNEVLSSTFNTGKKKKNKKQLATELYTDLFMRKKNLLKDS